MTLTPCLDAVETLTIRFWSIFFGTDGNQRDVLGAYEHGDIPGTRSLEQGGCAGRRLRLVCRRNGRADDWSGR